MYSDCEAKTGAFVGELFKVGRARVLVGASETQNLLGNESQRLSITKIIKKQLEGDRVQAMVLG
jgi:hypothetical protein